MNGSFGLRRVFYAIATCLLLAATVAVAEDVPACVPATPSPGALSPEQMAEWGITMPQVEFCTSDLDCGGCTPCIEGTCDTVLRGGSGCLCHDECVRIGKKSCDRPASKPLCPGECSASPPRRALPCGRGDDTLRLEPFDGEVCRVPPVAAAAPRGTILVQRSPGREP